MLKAIPKDYHDTSKGTLKLLWEEEWRALGITQVRHSPLLCRYSSAGNTDRGPESRMGALRSPRARASYPTIQVRSFNPPDLFDEAHRCPPGDHSTTSLRSNSTNPCPHKFFNVR